LVEGVRLYVAISLAIIVIETALILLLF